MFCWRTCGGVFQLEDNHELVLVLFLLHPYTLSLLMVICFPHLLFCVWLFTVWKTTAKCFSISNSFNGEILPAYKAPFEAFPCSECWKTIVPFASVTRKGTAILMKTSIILKFACHWATSLTVISFLAFSLFFLLRKSFSPSTFVNEDFVRLITLIFFQSHLMHFRALSTLKIRSE